jgi:hypothetical protein
VFPLATGAIIVALSIVNLLTHLGLTLRVRQASPKGSPDIATAGPANSDNIPDVFTTATRAEWLSAMGWMAGFFAMLLLLGALVAVPLFAVAYLLRVSHQSPARAGVYALASWAFVYGLFDRLLRIPLPSGVF